MPKTLKELVKKIVKQANELKNRHTSQKAARVNYAAIFSQTKREYDRLRSEADRMGTMIVDGNTGPLYHIKAITTAAGPLKILKVRMPDRSRPGMGDVDFTVKNYNAFRKKIRSRSGFKLMKLEEFEMIELSDPSSDVKAYFSNKPIDKELGA